MFHLELLPALAQVLPMDITIDPNSNGLPGIGQLRKIVGASMTVGLILAVLALIISPSCGRWARTRPTLIWPAAASWASSSPSAPRS